MSCSCGLNLKDHLEIVKHAEKCVCETCIAHRKRIQEYLDSPDLIRSVGGQVQMFIFEHIRTRVLSELNKTEKLTAEQFGNLISTILDGIAIGVVTEVANLAQDCSTGISGAMAANQHFAYRLSMAIYEVAKADALRMIAYEKYVDMKNRSVDILASSVKDVLDDLNGQMDKEELKDTEEKQAVH